LVLLRVGPTLWALAPFTLGLPLAPLDALVMTLHHRAASLEHLSAHLHPHAAPFQLVRALFETIGTLTHEAFAQHRSSSRAKLAARSALGSFALGTLASFEAAPLATLEALLESLTQLLSAFVCRWAFALGCCSVLTESLLEAFPESLAHLLAPLGALGSLRVLALGLALGLSLALCALLFVRVHGAGRGGEQGEGGGCGEQHGEGSWSHNSVLCACA